MRIITLFIIIILALSLLSLSLKERKQLLSLDKTELVNIIGYDRKIIDKQKNDIEDYKKDIQKLEIKKARLAGRVFSMASNKAMVWIIIILVAVTGAVFVFFKVIKKS